MSFSADNRIWRLDLVDGDGTFLFHLFFKVMRIRMKPTSILIFFWKSLTQTWLNLSEAQSKDVLQHWSKNVSSPLSTQIFDPRCEGVKSRYVWNSILNYTITLQIKPVVVINLKTFFFSWSKSLILKLKDTRKSFRSHF